MYEEEKELFQEKLKVKEMSAPIKDHKMGFKLFKNLAKRRYVWAFCIFGFVDLFQLFSIVTNTPFYLSEVLGASTTFVSYIQLFGGFGCSIITIITVMLLPRMDKKVVWLKSRLSLLIIPQIVRLVGFCVFPQIKSLPGAVATLLITWGSYGTAFSGSIVTINYEIDPEQSSIILGIFNGFGVLGGFISPLVRAWMTSATKSIIDNDNYQNWKKWSQFYYLNGGASIIITIVIVIAVINNSNEWQIHPSLVTEIELKTKQYENGIKVNECV